MMNPESGTRGSASRTLARQLAQAGRLGAAEEAYKQVLASQPHDAEAVDFIAGCALARGDTQRAITMLNGAARVHRSEAPLFRSLGLAHLRAGQAEDAAEALRECLLLTPFDFVARLLLSEAEDKLGNAYAALTLSFAALTAAQERGAWRDEAAVPPALKETVRHAMQRVIRGRRELFARALEPLRNRFGVAEIERVEAALAIYLLDAPAQYPDARQRPSFLFVPGLPPTPYYSADRFEWVPRLEAATAAIRRELEALLPSRGNFEPFHKDMPADGYLSGTRGAPAWDTFFLFRHGERVDANAARCPTTAATLDAMPLARIRGHAPESLFSVLQPGTHIKPHRGVTNTRLVVHLPLIVPPDCALMVGGEEHRWQEGRCVVFDDTFEHEAWNRSEAPRAMLLLDVWNPDLTDAERQAVTELVAAIGNFNRDSRVEAVAE